MLELEARYRRLPGTRAAVGQSGAHCVIADRPEGRAGGGGGGFNGGQLLGLSLGACYCNDLQYTAEAMGVEIEDLDVQVLIDFGGEPTVAKEIEMQVGVDARRRRRSSRADRASGGRLHHRQYAASRGSGPHRRRERIAQAAPLTFLPASAAGAVEL